MSGESNNKRIPLVLLDLESTPVEFGNHFIVQNNGDEFILTIGQIVAPPFLGTEEERQEQLQQLDYVPVRIAGRYAMTRTRVAELIQVLTANLAKYDQRHEGEGG